MLDLDEDEANQKNLKEMEDQVKMIKDKIDYNSKREKRQKVMV